VALVYGRPILKEMPNTTGHYMILRVVAQEHLYVVIIIMLVHQQERLLEWQRVVQEHVERMRLLVVTLKN
jgi:hypothetical protein